MSGDRFSSAVRGLLRLYPRSYRDRYESEIVEVARHRLTRLGNGPVGRARVFGEVLLGAPGVWMDRMRTTTREGMMGETASRGSGWGLDVRFVARSLWRSRGYVLSTVVILACAVAANTSVLSYVRGTLLHEPAWPEPHEVAVVWGSNTVEGQLRDVISGPNFLDMQERITTLDPIAAFHTDGVYTMVDGRPEVLPVQEISVDFFDVLEVEPHLGRFFDDSERMSGREETVIVTYPFWRDRLGGSPAAIGSRMELDGRPRTVIGVTPEGFDFISPTPLFVPLHDDQLAEYDRGNIHFNVLARLAPGATLPTANQELDAIMAEIVSVHPQYEGWSFLAEPLDEVSTAAVRPVILLLAASVALVLLIALVNLATLFRIRAFAREAELGVRSALGAGRSRLLRVLVLETISLSVAGAVLGLIATPFILAWVADLVPVWVAIPDSAARVPILLASLDPAVAAVSFGSAVLGSLLLTAPAYRQALKLRAPSNHTRVHPGMVGTRVLVATELAVATTLCIGAALVVRSTGELLSTDVGLEAEELLTMYFGDAWGLDAEERTAYFRQVVESVESVAGVRRAGVMGYVDFQAEDDFAGVTFLDRDRRMTRDTREEWRRVDEGLFEAAGFRIARGRGFDSGDFQGRPRVALVNESFARKHYPAGEALGEMISTHNAAYRELTIVGIVADVRSLGPAAPAPPMIYAPFQGDPRGTQGLHVRVAGNPMQYEEAVREAIWAVDSRQPIDRVSAMTTWVDMWIAVPKATRALVGSLASLAWLLATVGVFGVVGYAVRTRRSELGIRVALGASPRRLERDQLRAIAPVIVTGVIVGLVGGLLAARAASSVLHGVGPIDPVSIGAALLFMGLAAATAALLPARRAARVDPMEVIYRS